MIRHLQAEELQRYLEESLGGAQRQEIEAHLEGCLTCQEALQRLTDTLPPVPAESGPTSSNGMYPPLPQQRRDVPAIAGYEIVRELGRGGMGVVYLARQVALDRLVALKMILHADCAGREVRDRFAAEAKALARLRHPNIVPVHEVGEHEGTPFFSLEYCPGGSLAQQLAGRPLAALEAAGLAETLAGAVQAAHEANVIHRDLKPANVLLGADGTPRIADFGLARTLDQTGDTQTGQVLGTPSYMAPEQAQGKRKDQEIGPAADVYALGAILYELLTGRPPFQGNNPADVLVQVLTEEPKTPRSINAHVPRDLQTICLKCLEKDPNKRYASAQDLALDLRRFAQDEPIQARPAPPWERAVKRLRRRPALALAALLIVVAGLGTGGVLWQKHRLDEHRQEVAAEQERQRQEKEIKVEYYRRWIRRRGMFEGVGPLTAAEASRRSLTCKFSRQGGRVVKVELVNGHGYPHSMQGIGTIIARVGPEESWRQACSIDFHYHTNGQIAREVGRDRAGREMWHFLYTTPDRARFTDREGSLRPGAGSWASDVKFVRTADGLEKELHFLDVFGRPAPDPNGVHGYRSDHDERGFPVVVTCLNAAGAPTLHRDGYAQVKAHYDEHGNTVKSAYFGLDGRPALHRDGYSGMRIEHNEHGNLVRLAYFGLDGKPALHRDGNAGLTARHDERGNLVEQSFFGTDGKPALRKAGNAVWKVRCDERGNVVEQWFFGLAGQPTLNKQGVHWVKTRFDERGNVVEVKSFGTDGKPALNRQGFARLTKRYDERGNLIEEAFFGRDGQPVLNKVGVARVEIKSDERGNMVEQRYFGTDGKPTRHTNGNTVLKARYDERGNKVEQAYFGVDGKPTLGKQGIHLAKYRYDERGNLVEQRYFGIDGQPAPHNDGNAVLKARYDERGNLVEQRYFDRADRPTRIKAGYHSIKSRFDARGNAIEKAYFDTDGQPALHTDGNAVLKARYDERGNKVEQSYFDRAGKPMRIKAGYHRVTCGYDERDDRSEEAYFDTNGQPVLPGTGYTRATFKRDEQGRLVEQTLFRYPGQPVPPGVKDNFIRKTVKFDAHGWATELSYHDLAGRPVLHRNGYHKVTKKYDTRGNLIEEASFGRDNQPIADKDGYHKTIIKYDQRGKRIEEACFGTDGQPALNNSGYTRITFKRDDQGRLVEQTLFRYPNQAVPPGADDFVRKTLKLDAHGWVIELSYHDLAGRPVLHRGGYHKVTKKYDVRGNVIEEASFDRDNKPTSNHEGYHKAVYTHDHRGKQTGLAVFGIDGKPVLCKHGFHLVQTRFDEHGNQVENAYLDLDGKQVCHRELGYAKIVATWDPAGKRLLEVAYHDQDGKRLRVETVVRAVVAGSQAERVGLRPGDVLLKYDGADFPRAALFTATRGKARVIPLLIRRGDRTIEVGLAPGLIGIMMEDRAPPRERPAKTP